MSQNGKTHSPRPYSVDLDTFDWNWEQTFGKKEPAKSDGGDIRTDRKAK